MVDVVPVLVYAFKKDFFVVLTSTYTREIT